AEEGPAGRVPEVVILVRPVAQVVRHRRDRERHHQGEQPRREPTVRPRVIAEPPRPHRPAPRPPYEPISGPRRSVRGLAGTGGPHRRKAPGTDGPVSPESSAARDRKLAPGCPVHLLPAPDSEPCNGVITSSRASCRARCAHRSLCRVTGSVRTAGPAGGNP